MKRSNSRPGYAKLSLAAVLLTFVVGAEETPQVEVAKSPELREALIDRVNVDQEARKAAIAWAAEHGVNGMVDQEALTEKERSAHAELWARVSEIDADNTQWLKTIVNGRGWLRYSDVGVDGGNAAWLLVQHADADPAFQRLCLDLMAELPDDEMSKPRWALLTDRVLLAEGKNQIYGTQFGSRDGEWAPINLEDEENVDVRRAAVDLPSLAEYKKALEAAMRGEEVE